MIKTVVMISIFIFFSYGYGFSLTLPKTPKIPKMPKMPTITIKKKNNQKKGPPQKQEKVKTFLYHVEVILNKGSKAKGTIVLKRDYLIVSKKKGDFTYKKKVHFSDINKIEILLWQETKIKSKNKKEIAHVFHPVQFRIFTIDKKQFLFSGRLIEFERFQLTNTWGKTFVHSIFYDYWMLKGGKGHWYNTKSKNFKFNRTNPHPLALKSIEFNKTKD